MIFGLFPANFHLYSAHGNYPLMTTNERRHQYVSDIIARDQHHAHRNKRTTVMTWKPNVTVATVVKQNEKYLIVEELIKGSHQFNQPAGHLEEHESILDAAVRETLEETGYSVKLTGFIGATLWQRPSDGLTMLRFNFHADVIDYDEKRTLDQGIITAHWLSLDEIKQRESQLRSPLVLKSIMDAETHNYPLTMCSKI